ncbi:MAG: PAS domain S-box protein, partial [Verrucomicrobiaceae bacterium]
MKTDQPSAAALIERVAEAIVVLDRQGSCTFINRHAERLLGIPREKLLGGSFWNALPGLEQCRLREECTKAYEEQKLHSFEEQHHSLDRWWEYRISPAPDGVSIHFTDISEQKRREEDLQLCEQSYSRMVHSLGGIVWVADGETLQFLYVSGQAPNVLGYPIREWLENVDFWRKHVHPEDLDRCLERRYAALTNREDTTLEYRMLAADGHVVWFTETVSAHVHLHGQIRLRGILMEITEQKRLENEHSRLWRDLQERIK